MSETIQELYEKIENLTESLKTVDLEEDSARLFIETKFLVLELHAQTEKEEISLKSNSDQIKYKKQFNLYQSIQSILSGKCNEFSIFEMVVKLNKCKELVSIHL